MMTHVLSVIATVYGTYGAVAILLQAHQVIARHESCDVSVKFLVSFTAGYAIWLAYGLSAGSVPLIISDSVGLCCGTATLAVALAYRKVCGVKEKKVPFDGR